MFVTTFTVILKNWHIKVEQVFLPRSKTLPYFEYYTLNVVTLKLYIAKIKMSIEICRTKTDYRQFFVI